MSSVPERPSRRSWRVTSDDGLNARWFDDNGNEYPADDPLVQEARDALTLGFFRPEIERIIQRLAAEQAAEEAESAATSPKPESKPKRTPRVSPSRLAKWEAAWQAERDAEAES